MRGSRGCWRAASRGYDPAVLERLCLTGAVGWGRLSPHPATRRCRPGTTPERRRTPRRRVVPTSVAPVTFFVREDADWMSPQAPAAAPKNRRGLSRQARAVLHHLQRAGASFFADIVRGTRLLKSEVEDGAVGTGRGRTRHRRRLRQPARAHRSRAGARATGSGRAARPRHSTGRWSLLRTDGGRRPPGAARSHLLDAAAPLRRRVPGARSRANRSCRPGASCWSRSGGSRIAAKSAAAASSPGFIGEQFALPVAVESLRAMRQAPPTGQIVTLSAADPLNLAGVIVPGDRVTAISGRFVRFRDGVALDTADDAGASLHDLKDAKAGA